MHEIMKYIHTFYIDMGLIWGIFFFTCRIGRWHANAAHNDAARLCCGRGVGDSEHDHIANGLGSVGPLGLDSNWGRVLVKATSRTKCSSMATCTLASKAGCAVHISASAIEVSCRAASSRTRNGVGGSISGSLQRTPLTSLTFQIIGAYFFIVRFSAVFWCSIFLTPSCGLRQPTIVFNQAPVMGQGSNQMMWDTENPKFFCLFFQLLSSSCIAPWSSFACDSMKWCLHISKADHDCARPARANGCDRSHGQVPWPATADACPFLSEGCCFHAEYLWESKAVDFLPQVVPMMLAGPNQYGNGQARSWLGEVGEVFQSFFWSFQIRNWSFSSCRASACRAQCRAKALCHHKVAAHRPAPSHVADERTVVAQPFCSVPISN